MKEVKDLLKKSSFRCSEDILSFLAFLAENVQFRLAGLNIYGSSHLRF